MQALLLVLAPFAVAAVVSAFATPIAGRLARVLRVIDRPSERKVNRRQNIPLMGGLGVALGFFMGISVAILLLGDGLGYQDHLEGLLLGGLLLAFIGAFDDRFSLPPRAKFGAQIVAAAVAIYFGFEIDHVRDPVTRTAWMLPDWAAWLATTLWIVGVTNAINLIDGLDGLATGVAAIIATTLTLICWQTGCILGVVIGSAFVGALLGFLPFNFTPASIVLGDTGSLFIGFTLALLALEGYRQVDVLSFIVPILALAVPILDTGLSILRRLRRRTGIFLPDRQHIHHRLLETEGSQRSAVLSLYFLTVCFCLIALSFTRIEGYVAILFLVAVALLTIRLLRNLGIFEVGQADGAEDAAPEAHEEKAT